MPFFCLFLNKLSPVQTTALQIEKCENSRIGEVNFAELPFGEIFTDHMFICEFKNGQWNTPRIQPYQPLQMAPSARVFHYGQAIFEGMKAYKDDEGGVWLFRPDQNFERTNKSAERMAMPPIPREYFFEGLQELLKLDQEWIKPGLGNTLYVRPFMIASQAGIIASAAEEFTFMIICAPAQSYFTGSVAVKIEEHYSRAANGGFGYAKAAGNYAGQFFPTQLAKKEGYQQVIWTDATHHQYIEEAGTMNIFVRLKDKLLTCPVSDRILDGVTRKSLLQLAQDMGIETEVRQIGVSELVEGISSGEMTELFGAGTAAVVSPISAFSYKDIRYELPELGADSYAMRLKSRLMDIQYNRGEDPHGWRYEIKTN